MGITCIASRSGRIAASNFGLRPATIPTGSAIATASTTATSTCVNVSIVSYQMPAVSVGTCSPAITSAAIATVAATRRPPLAQPMPVAAAGHRPPRRVGEEVAHRREHLGDDEVADGLEELDVSLIH